MKGCFEQIKEWDDKMNVCDEKMNENDGKANEWKRLAKEGIQWTEGGNDSQMKG
jgi:hypothetical protein